MSDYSIKPYTATLYITIFFGILGIHRFYVGKMGTGVLYLLTVWFWWLGLVIRYLSSFIWKLYR